MEEHDLTESSKRKRHEGFVCKACRKQGGSSELVTGKSSMETYTCTRCRYNLGKTQFPRDHFQRTLQAKKLKCNDCISGVRKGEQCNQPNCLSFVEENNLTNIEQINRKRGFVCQSCRTKGYSLKDLNSYDCSICSNSGGRRKFSDLDMNFAYWAKQKKLTCIDCAQKMASAK